MGPFEIKASLLMSANANLQLGPAGADVTAKTDGESVSVCAELSTIGWGVDADASAGLTFSLGLVC